MLSRRHSSTSPCLHMTTMKPCIHLLLALLTVAAVSHQVAGEFTIVSRSTAVGPGGTGGKDFNTLNAFLDNGPIARIAFFASTVTQRSGLAFWYGKTKHEYGMPISSILSQHAPSAITQVEIQWTENKDGKQGQFVSFTFGTQGQSMQLGARMGSAKTASFTAPQGCFLGGIIGQATDNNLLTVQFVWAKAVPVKAREVAGVSDMYMVRGSPEAATAFDDSDLALKNPDITQLATTWGTDTTGKGGLSVFYGDRGTTHGAYPTGAQMLRFNTRFIRIKGSYKYAANGKPGYFCHLYLSSGTGYRLTIGKECLGEKTIDILAPRGTYLGAFRGYEESNQLIGLSFVWFKEKSNTASV